MPRCEILKPNGERCQCWITEERGRCWLGLYREQLYICENHQKVLRRGKTITDRHGRRWQASDDSNRCLQEDKN